MTLDRPVTVFAPAKINLYLHVTGKRDDGYHLLDSLVVFADIGDKITIEPSSSFSFQINGPFASAFEAKDRDESINSSNLVVRAARAIAKAAGHNPDFRITLIKNLPLVAGIGGGSSDAAAVIWGLMNTWNISITASPWLPELMTQIGADVPACLRCLPVQMSGIGDILSTVPGLPEIPVVLVNPGRHCPTPDVFRRFIGPMSGAVEIPDDLSATEDLIAFLERQDNDLTHAACDIVPDIATAMAQLKAAKGCLMARMSGSGATVFALFENMEEAQDAAEFMTLGHPFWWVRSGTINSPQRY